MNKEKTHCEYCDPEYFYVYGYCGNCKRKYNPPLWDPKGEIPYLNHKEIVENWQVKETNYAH